MPTIFKPVDLPVKEQDGVVHTTLADGAMLGTNALHVERITLEAGKAAPTAGAADAERFIYVIRGAGQAHVAGEIYPLGPESVLWIDPGEACVLEAGAEGLEVLACRAPAG